MEHSAVLVSEFHDHVAILRLQRPAQRNSLSIATLNEMANAISDLLSGNSCRALIITGTDDVFASGADLSELQNLDPDEALKFARLGQKVFQSIADAEALTIAAINGYCMGGGLDLALACDVRVASSTAMFAHPGAKRGIITGWGGTQRLPRLIGRSRALEMFATARMVTSEEALRWGLASRVGDPVLDLAMELAQQVK